jgi:hypothetical protein
LSKIEKYENHWNVIQIRTLNKSIANFPSQFRIFKEKHSIIEQNIIEAL